MIIIYKVIYHVTILLKLYITHKCNLTILMFQSLPQSLWSSSDQLAFHTTSMSSHCLIPQVHGTVPPPLIFLTPYLPGCGSLTLLLVCRSVLCPPAVCSLVRGGVSR